MTTATLRDADTLRKVAESAARDLEGASAIRVFEWAADEFGDKFVGASSMQDAVLPHLASTVIPGVDILFLDTGYHFAETIATRDAVSAAYDITLRNLTPAQSVAEQDATYGTDLYRSDPDLCCTLRKTHPLDEAIDTYEAWATGVRRSEAITRRDTPVVSFDARRERIKVAPIVAWSDDDVEAYIAEHAIITNPLLTQGYPSIGCATCTRKVKPGRAGRALGWSGQGGMRDQHMSDHQRPGGTVWFTGLSGAGKSTLAERLVATLRERGERVELLDGDELRTSLSAGLGFSREDRNTHVTRVGFVADLLARNGVWAIVPVIAPYTDARAENRARHERSGSRYLEVFVATSLAECARRDVKGLYAKAEAGELTGMTGVDDPYEAPTNPELGLETQGRTVEESLAEILRLLDEERTIT